MALDYAITSSFDLAIANGDFVKVEPTYMEVAKLGATVPGDWKAVSGAHWAGFKMSDFIRSTGSEAFITQRIGQQLERDGKAAPDLTTSTS
jgi:hypothetical protein